MSEVSPGDNPFQATPRRWSWRRKAIVAALVVFVTGFGVIAWKLGPYFYWRYSAQQRVNAEFARLQAAGEPLTAAELHAQYKVPEGTPDLTAEWSKALADLNAVIPTAQDPEFQNLPVIGPRSVDDLDPSAPDSCLVATEAFLLRAKPQVDAVLKAAGQNGEVRFPVKFEDHIAALLPHVEHVRVAARVFAVRARVCRIRGDIEEEERSLVVLLKLPRTLDHSRTLVEQLVRLALTGVACDAVNRAANGGSLTSEQLGKLASQLDELDFRNAVWNCFSGERVMMWEAMDANASLVADDESGLTRFIDGAGPVDRAFFLDVLARAVDASRRDFPEASSRFDLIDQDCRQLTLLAPLERMHYLYSLLLVPVPCTAYVAFFNADARCKATRAALVAHQFRQRTGQWPVSIGDLKAEGLPTACVDPFTGVDLLLRQDGEDLIVYSAGSDQLDDGGVEDNARFKPDIIVRLGPSE